ncbi:MAG: Co2+/Mg2+ efflux protein ApaG [Alphaproteobacteria bacterium]
MREQDTSSSDLPTWQAETNGVRISVTPQYLPDQSSPEVPRHVWAYHVEIANTGDQTVQLLERTWEIIDATGRIERVNGPGVVGQTPVLQPGQAFSYTSGAPLATESGFMSGHYGMIIVPSDTADEPTRFDAQIPAFSLDMPQGSGAVLH